MVTEIVPVSSSLFCGNSKLYYSYVFPRHSHSVNATEDLHNELVLPDPLPNLGSVTCITSCSHKSEEQIDTQAYYKARTCIINPGWLRAH